MRKFSLILPFLISTFFSVFAQITIQGRVLHQSSHQPIAYANIGVINSNVGTISNPDGTFAILIPAKLKNDTLTFSALGFEKHGIALQNLSATEMLNIFLNEKIIALKSVTIARKKEKNKLFELGNDVFKGGVLETDTSYAGGAVALLIENKAPNYHQDLVFPVYLEKASLRILRNNLPKFKFRIRLNQVDSLSGQPGSDILSQSLVVESTMKNGWLDFDLAPLNLQIHQAFFVTFEQILELNDRTAIAEGYRSFMNQYPEKIIVDTVEFEGEKIARKTIKGKGIDLPGTFIAINSNESAARAFTCYTRETSLGQWKKVREIVTAKVLLSNQPKDR
ncbi:MAG: carboxypeptidase-like regulatory domain-containing protein [Microscillaceae bacterium]|jgi:hypothetical protein|nr:carboxypeptidase-like regulatory domain-containing protein [Microscillaceae bacterium]